MSALLVAVLVPFAGQPDKSDTPKQPGVEVEVQCVDNSAIRVLTAQFGEQPLKLGDAREIRTGGAAPASAAVAQATGNMMGYQNQIGIEVQLQVTGMLGGAVWGTDVYTLDSNLATAAVHA